MAKAKAQKKTANKKTPKKATKKATKRTATTKAVTVRSRGGRPLFDGKDETLVCSKLKAAFAGGASNLQASIYAGISRQALDRYLEKNEEFRAVCNELSNVPVLISHTIINAALQEHEKVDNLYDADGNKIEYTPTNRAINAAKYHLKSRDPRYMPKQLNGNIDIPVGDPLTPEREAEIAEALKNWGTKTTEEDHYVIE